MNITIGIIALERNSSLSLNVGSSAAQDSTILCPVRSITICTFQNRRAMVIMTWADGHNSSNKSTSFRLKEIYDSRKGRTVLKENGPAQLLLQQFFNYTQRQIQQHIQNNILSSVCTEKISFVRTWNRQKNCPFVSQRCEENLHYHHSWSHKVSYRTVASVRLLLPLSMLVSLAPWTRSKKSASAM